MAVFSQGVIEAVGDHSEARVSDSRAPEAQ